MTNEQIQLLSLLSDTIYEIRTDSIVIPCVLEEAKLQAVSSLITNDYRTLGSNIRVINAHAELTKVLTGIPFTTFKGYASGYYYPEPSYRPMGDVDFITYPMYNSIVVKRLEAAGWKRLNIVHARHETFKKRKVIIELHTEIKGIPNGADGIVSTSTTVENKVRAFFADLISTSRSIETQQGAIIIPDDFHHGLIMLLHVAGHMINDGGVGLRHLCDWAVYVNRVDIEQFRSKLESVGLWTFACQLTAVCTAYLNLPKQSWAGEWSQSFLAELIEDVLQAGNFGKKEAGRKATMTLHRSSFVEMTRKHYPQADYPLLLPIYLIINLLRYACLVSTGKRRFIKPSTFVEAKGRDELYKQFRLFEV